MIREKEKKWREERGMKDRKNVTRESRIIGKEGDREESKLKDERERC